MGTKSCTKIFQDFQMTGNVLSWQNLSPRFLNGGCHANLDAARQINCATSFPWGISINHLKHKNAHGDCDAAIAKATAAVTHVQSLSQEVSSGDERLGLFGFDLSSAETGFWWPAEEQDEVSKPIHGIYLVTTGWIFDITLCENSISQSIIDLGTWLQKNV